jgi:hypothetical protein
MPSTNKSVSYRILFLFLAIILLISATWAGLIRLGWQLPSFSPKLASSHGPLMVVGFFGTLISLERAVALQKKWAYIAPLAFGCGGVLLLTGYFRTIGIFFFTLGSFWLAAVFINILIKQRAAYLYILAFGSITLLIGNLLWLSGWQVPQLVFWWAGYLILTIAGERLELSRIRKLSSFSQILFIISITFFSLGLVTSLFNLLAGIKISSAGMILLALWLLNYDIARRTIKKSGLTRYIAVCLLSGYFWLIIAGIIGYIYRGQPAGFVYDAMLHSIFIGFVFSMIFGHAPIIFPAILNLDLQFKPALYFPLILLHLSLIFRIVGDLISSVMVRKWAGLINIVAVLLYVLIISPLWRHLFSYGNSGPQNITTRSP